MDTSGKVLLLVLPADRLHELTYENTFFWGKEFFTDDQLPTDSFTILQKRKEYILRMKKIIIVSQLLNKSYEILLEKPKSLFELCNETFDNQIDTTNDKNIYSIFSYNVYAWSESIIEPYNQIDFNNRLRKVKIGGCFQTSSDSSYSLYFSGDMQTFGVGLSEKRISSSKSKESFVKYFDSYMIFGVPDKE